MTASTRAGLLTILLIFLSAGCAASSDSGSAAPPRVKPVDHVRADLVSLADKVDVAVASARSAVNESGPGSRAARSQFARELLALDESVQELRSSATSFRERADEYLTIWSSDKVTITPGGDVAGAKNTQRDAPKAKYDEMVATVLEARELLLPLLAQLKGLDDQLGRDPTQAQMQAMRAEVEQASQRGSRASALLRDAVARLDELKTMLQSARK